MAIETQAENIYRCPACCGDGWDTEMIMGSDGEPEQIQVQCEYCGGIGWVEDSK